MFLSAPWRTVVLALLALALVPGCSKSVAFTSEPPGADIHIDGEYVGKTPATLDLDYHSFSEKSVRLSLPGYHDTVAILHADHPSTPLIIVGVVLLFLTLVGGIVVLFFAGWEYQNSYHFRLDPLAEPVPGQVPAPPPFEGRDRRP